MSGRGLRSILQPVLFLGIASILHGLLFLIPGGGPTKRVPETTRGVRVKAYVERSSDAPPSTSGGAVSPATVPEVPQAAREMHYSTTGSRTASGESEALGIQDSGSRPQESSTAGEGTLSPNEWRDYTNRLRSAGVRDWADETARKARQGWKGAGTGSLKGSGIAESGSGKGTSGKGSGGDGALFMDPRVGMIVTSYPSTGIERRYTPVRYPDLKFKKHEYRSGWWSVYIEIRTDRNGKVIRYNVLRPETDGALERQFVAQVKNEIAKWSFDPAEAEIHVDVRFYVE